MSTASGPFVSARLARLCALVGVVVALLMPSAVIAVDRAQLLATNEQGFARLILDFPERLDLPPYQIKMDNSVLALTFDEPIELPLPDIAAALPDYIGIARVDPDGRGLRFGLRAPFAFNRLEAGEQLFIDLLPTTWQGLPPALPPEVVASLAERARDAAMLAEQKRRAEEAKLLNPIAQVRVGRNPTFVRVQFDWNVSSGGKFSQDGNKGRIDFDWPVPVDVTALEADLPPGVTGVTNVVTPAGSAIEMTLAEGTTPRFYQTNPMQFMLDFDVAPTPSEAAAAEPTQNAAETIEQALALAENGGEVPEPTEEATAEAASDEPITPFITQIGSTVRVVFPFHDEVPAAVFRRGNLIWMLFDAPGGINQPDTADMVAPMVSDFSVTPTGDSQVVRLELVGNELATLGSEGPAWVLSLGDKLLTPTEPLALNRRRSGNGQFEITADLATPYKVHRFDDPVVGDTLDVVTAYPPARGVLRSMEFVDFEALRSVHGLVVKPLTDQVDVALEETLAVIGSPDGLTVSALDLPRQFSPSDDASRAGYVDLEQYTQPDPAMLSARIDAAMERAAESEGAERDMARLDLARLYIANQLSFEALGVLRVLDTDLKSAALKSDVRLGEAIANVLAQRPQDALAILNSSGFNGQSDPIMWRTIAKSEAFDFPGARQDAMAAESIVETYPLWVRNAFFLAGARAAVETDDEASARRYMNGVDFAALDTDDMSRYQLLMARIAEMSGDDREALDTYGEIIKSEIRPTRAEAVYRTLKILDKEGRIDLPKAIATLAAESIMWRGTPLEAEMLSLLADFYFRDADYRDGFQTVEEAVANYPDSPPVNSLADSAQKVFGRLYLDGEADKMNPVDALALYYDFRQLTPAGTRGDEMIRNLARRLVKVDLLDQAAQLLQYQVDNRLDGAAKAQVAADLAVIRLANREPDSALRVLNQTRMMDLPPSLERQRRVLEARALIDAGRDQLALELLKNVTGRDADMLRIDAHWRAKRYADAAALLEGLYAGEEGKALTQPARMNIINAAVGYVLAGDTMGVQRLRSKFGEQMSQSAEWPMFDYITGDVVPTSTEFKEVARQVAGIDRLNSFLTAYRESYGGKDALTPAGPASQDMASAG